MSIEPCDTGKNGVAFCAADEAETGKDWLGYAQEGSVGHSDVRKEFATC